MSIRRSLVRLLQCHVISAESQELVQSVGCFNGPADAEIDHGRQEAGSEHEHVHACLGMVQEDEMPSGKGVTGIRDVLM